MNICGRAEGSNRGILGYIVWEGKGLKRGHGKRITLSGIFHNRNEIGVKLPIVLPVWSDFVSFLFAIQIIGCG